MSKKLAAFARIFISVLMIYIMGILSFASLLGTTGMETVTEGNGMDTVVNRIREMKESVIYYSDDILVNLIMLALFGLICFLILPKMKKFTLKAELIFITVWTILIGTIWVNSSMVQPTFDSQYVMDAAQHFAQDDFSDMSTDYIQQFPYQLGYILLNEIIIRIASANFGEPDNLVFIQVINAVFLALIYDGIILINHTVFKDQRIRHLTVLLLTFCTQPIIFCSFLYGIFPAFAFAVWAVYLEILYFRKNKLWMGLVSALCIGLAVLFKTNNYIVLIAMLAIGFVELLQRKNYLKDIACLALACVLSLNAVPVVTSFYEKRSGVEMGDAIPYISWIACGMSESSRAPGWYNDSVVVGTFKDSARNADVASEKAKALIQKRLDYFKENPHYRKDFFYRKFVSQWNETSYQSIWNNTVRKQYKEKGKLSQWVCYDGEEKVKSYMDFYAQLIFWGCLLALTGCLRNRNLASIAMPLMILGGVMYHMLAEAKSQYAISYFILMIGVAAYGICIAYDMFAKRMQKYPKFAGFFPLPETLTEKTEVPETPAVPETSGTKTE